MMVNRSEFVRDRLYYNTGRFTIVNGEHIDIGAHIVCHSRDPDECSA